MGCDIGIGEIGEVGPVPLEKRNAPVLRGDRIHVNGFVVSNKVHVQNQFYMFLT